MRKNSRQLECIAAAVTLRRRFGLFLTLAHFLDGNPILPLGRNIKFLGRFLDSLFLVRSFNRTETFGALPDYIDTPAGHLQQASSREHGQASGKLRALTSAFCSMHRSSTPSAHQSAKF
jgi:hypothetical protein